MSNSDQRIPSDPDYTSILGIVTYDFERLRWDAIWCCQWLKPGSITLLADEYPKTIAVVLEVVCAGNDAQEKTAQEFKAIVEEHNELILSAAGTGPKEEQELFEAGKVWDLSALQLLADRIASCCILLEGSEFRPSTPSA